MRSTGVGVSNKQELVNLYLVRVRLGWCTKGHKVYTGLGRMFLRPVCCCSCYQYQKRFAVGVQTVEIGEGPKSLMEWSKGRQELGCCLAVCVMCAKLIYPLSEVSYPLFYRPRGIWGYRREKEGKTKGREVPSKVSGLPFPLSLYRCHGRPCQRWHAR